LIAFLKGFDLFFGVELRVAFDLEQITNKLELQGASYILVKFY